ncbi:MAG TPA: amino acid adenylation domain-containing protein [Candidatus Binataceae bacterium]|nr:amino acid adenylation domain-containing protein [Candidatus Binataceae bacterium]
MSDTVGKIAIIGMAGRFPGARNIREFWDNLAAGRESITRFSVDELEVRDRDRLAAMPNYVRARAVMHDADKFDAAFFEMMPREAEMTDPQHRLLLECAWHAFDDAGYDPLSCGASVGVYAGCSYNSYFLGHLGSGPAYFDDYADGFQVSNFPATLASHAEFLATRIAYKLNLRGPAFSLGAGCSTSLIAVCQAALALQNYQCDMALAGGVSITFPQRRGYLHEPGGMVSPDGHCRAFDAAAQGTVFGDGAAMVLLKRFEDALADGDNIRAVILGFGINNDGAAKVGFSAPSVEGQARAIAMAHAGAGVDASTISYIEAHGTGTPLGDPVEFAALTRAFRIATTRRNFCAIGTAKANVGHLDVASGVTGLIKTVLSMEHRAIPPLLHFRTSNPELEVEQSPFFFNTELRQWTSQSGPRRAGVSSFGMGGTNTHIVLEEADEAARNDSRWSEHLLLLSAKSETALDDVARNLAESLVPKEPQTPGTSPNRIAPHPADVAYTLMNGRHAFAERRFVVAPECDAMATALRSARTPSNARRVRGAVPPVAFMFPGQGSQYINMGRRLYDLDPVFRARLDEILELALSNSRLDLRPLLFPSGDPISGASLDDTAFAQPALFAIEYALAQTWISFGIEPAAMIGHSVGEFVVGCLAGVMPLEDALAMIVARGRLMQSMPRGAMLSVRLAEDKVRALLDDEVAIAAVNSPGLCVIAGPVGAIDGLAQKLTASSIANRRLATSHAFHSPMMDPVLGDFRKAFLRVTLNPPRIRFVSCVSGDWITDAEATSPDYWVSHLRQTVRFSAAVSRLIGSNFNLLEVGPGATLTTLARQHRASGGASDPQLVVSSMPDAARTVSEEFAFLNALGNLWIHGASPKWERLYAEERRQRLSLPGYPFERRRFWIDRRSHSVEHTSTVVEVSPAAAPGSQQAIEPPVAAPLAPLVQRTPEQMSEPSNHETTLKAAIASIFEDLSGLDISGMDAATSFLEMGFDSLFLTQVSQALQSKFGFKITFRQLLDQQSTLETLTAYVAARVPAAAPAPANAPASAEIPQVAAAPLQASIPHPANGAHPAAPVANVDGSLERLLKDQLATMSDLMARQLDVLRNFGAPAINGARPVEAASGLAVQIASPAAPSAFAPQPQGRFRPVAPGVKTDATPRQQAAISAFIERYNRRTASSKRHTEAHRRALADPRAVAGFRAQWKEIVYPIVTTRSAGSHLWDLDGNEYIDVVNGYGPIMLGHRPDFVVAAIEEQLRQGFETGPQTALAGEVAELISEMTGMERVTFCNTGSEAVMAAMRVARTVTGRDRVVMFTGDYHGMFDEVLVRGVGDSNNRRSLPIAPGIPRAKAENIIVLDYGAPESLDYIRTHADQLAAVLVEPVQSRHPALQPVEFLKELRRITAASGVALIFDEVVTGFRVHPGGCQALFGIRADMATYGKVIGGGLPIGVLAGSADFMDALDGGAWSFGDDSSPTAGMTFFAGTFVRHPLAMAAARAVLRHLKAEGPGLNERLNANTARMVAELNQFIAAERVPTHVETFASLAYFSFPSELPFASLLYYWMRAKGIHIQEAFPIFLTTAHDERDCAAIVAAFKESVLEMREADLLPYADSAAPLAAHPAAMKSVEPSPASAPTRDTVAARIERLTEAQREVWLSASLSDEASCSFNESFTLKLRGRLDQAALANSFNRVIARHDALRATIAADGEAQNFAPVLEIEIPFDDLRKASDSERDGRIRRMVTEDAGTPFDLIRGPLIRARLVRIAEEDHALIVTSHHIVCDGWSTNVMLDELARLYTAAAAGTSAALPSSMQYGDYVLAQLADSATGESRSTESYWLKEFADPVEPLNLPCDRPRPALKSFRGATCRRAIGAAAYQRIKRAGAKNRCTMFTTLLAGFKVLLARLSGQGEIVVGIPSAGQSSAAGENLVGHCVNFLPLRSRIAKDAPFADFLAQLRQTVVDAYEHQNYTYGTLVRKLELPRDPSHLPLLDVQFNLERIGGGLDFAGLAAEIDPNPKSFVNFDLFLNVVESDAGLVIDCDYNRDLFDEATIARWLGHYETLLEAFAANALVPVAQIALLNDRERHQMLVEWNDTHRDYPTDALVHELFEEQAARTPRNIALVFEDQQLTYAELDARANRLANHLQACGVREGDRVGIYLERSLDLVISILGILKAGCAYVPLDPVYPDERVEFIVNEAEIKVMLTQSALLRAVPSYKGKRIALDTERRTIEKRSSAAPRLSAESDALAYLIYTSGSTGKPKGVEIPHRAHVNLLLAMAHEPGMSASDVMLAITTIAFDIASLELLLPLIVGGQVVVASREMIVDGERLLAELERVEATVLQATPTTWRLLLEAGLAGRRKLKMLCGGEALPADLAQRLVATGGDLWNMYGPTETTVWSAVSRVRDSAVTIGRAIANTQIYVLDELRQPQPIGVSGELYIGGDGLARGYFKRAEMTAERFVRDSFSPAPAARMYRTGDLVRHLPHGESEFLGRIDRQVKLRGYRIELAEIEARIMEVPGVRETAVILRNDPSGEPWLVAYVVAQSRETPDFVRMRAALRAKLPDYMIPSFFMPLDALPRTANGKIDPKALPPTHETAPKDDDDADPAPLSASEETLQRIWSEVLGLRTVALDDDIFALGGDSIRILKIVSRARDAGMALDAMHVFQHRTIAEIARSIANGANPRAAALN